MPDGKVPDGEVPSVAVPSRPGLNGAGPRGAGSTIAASRAAGAEYGKMPFGASAGPVVRQYWACVQRIVATVGGPKRNKRGSTVWVALLHDAVDAAFPTTSRLPGIDAATAKPYLRQLLRQAPWTLWFGAVGSALAFQILPIFTVFWPLPACVLPASVRDRHANALANHRLYLVRMTMVMIKTIGGLWWGAAPQVRDKLGIPRYAADPQTVRDDQFRSTPQAQLTAKP